MMDGAFLEHPLWWRLAAVLLHFLWQGLLIGWLYWTLIRVLAIRSPRGRYVLGLSGLVLMVAAAGLTFGLVKVPDSEIRANGERGALGSRSRGTVKSFGTYREAHASRSPVLTQDPSIDNPKPPALAPSKPIGWVRAMVLGGWLLGVTLLGLRLLGGAATVLWWRWSSQALIDPHWQAVLQTLSKRLGLSRSPRLVVSSKAVEAFSLGLVRPLIVLPSSWLLKLSPETLEAVLAHELAHVRRWDVWANLFQRLVETWLFYHPVVWWLSRQVDQEREKCCDLKAVALTGKRLQYVKALAGVAELRQSVRQAIQGGPLLATGMGGKDMMLLDRVRHVLGETERAGGASRWLAGALALVIPATLWVGTMMLPVSAADEEGTVVAQAEKDREDDERDRDREDDDRKRDREDDARRDGDRREGDREELHWPDGERREAGPRDGGFEVRERPRGDKPRDGERREAGPRDGGFEVLERPRGDKPRDGERREAGPRDGERPRGEDLRRVWRIEGVPPRGDQPAPPGELMQMIRDLRREVEMLRKEVRELRGGERRDGEPRNPNVEETEDKSKRWELQIERRDGKLRNPNVRDREVDRPRDGERPRPAAERRDGERPRPAAERRDGERPDRERPEADREERRPGERREESQRRVPDGGTVLLGGETDVLLGGETDVLLGGETDVLLGGETDERREGKGDRREAAREDDDNKKGDDDRNDKDDDDKDDVIKATTRNNRS